MKNYFKQFGISTLLVLFMTLSCTEDFLERAPLGAISENAIANEQGINGSLIVAYRTLSGSNIAAWYTSPMNWAWGGIRSDDSYKGSEASDQGPELNPIERFEVLPSNSAVTNKWRACYDGIGMANIVLRQLATAEAGISAEVKKRITAETLFIRGYHHFEAKRVYNNVPFVDETALTTADYKAITNTVSIWPKIESDLKFAYENLPSTQAQKGRVNKWAAGAFYAKALIYQNKYAEAKVVFDNIIANGTTSGGEKYGLIDEYKNVFRGESENSKEIIFGVQYTVGDGTNGANSNKDAELTNPHNDGPVGCCGFYQPSQSLVNSFKTANGLPLFDTFNNVNIRNFESNPTNFVDNSELDPRLDYTVGRIGLPYKDYGVAKSSWIRNLANGGPWLPNKHIQWKDEVGAFYVAGGWGQGQLGKNQTIMRYADLLLMAAECEVEVGSLEKAREYVNLIRDRAAKSTPVGGTVPAANYKISTYTAPWTNKDIARTAVRFERKIELGMEGHRFFDLVRWGVAESVINAFFAKESVIRTHLAGARFVAGKDEYAPIPEQVIQQSAVNGKITLEQNKGY